MGEKQTHVQKRRRKEAGETNKKEKKKSAALPNVKATNGVRRRVSFTSFVINLLTVTS